MLTRERALLVGTLACSAFCFLLAWLLAAGDPPPLRLFRAAGFALLMGIATPVIVRFVLRW